MSNKHYHQRSLQRRLRAGMWIPSTFGAILTLTACGGGSSDSTPPVSNPEPPQTTQQVKVVDGAIKGAKVCLDMNSNGACDTGEPNAVTATDGTASITFPLADANKYKLLAMVGTDAVDADHGPVTVAFSLQAPADKPAVISPLTTMVAAQAEAAKQSTAEAEKLVQEALGLTVSPLADFTASKSADEATAGAIARLLVVATQKQSTDLVTAKDAAGNALSAADVAKAVQQNLLSQLQTVAQAATDPAVAQAATAAEKSTALTAAATKLAADVGLTLSSVSAAVQVAKLPPSAEQTEDGASAGEILRWFTYKDAGNYSFRTYKSTAAQAAVVNGKRQFTEYREEARATNGVNTFYQQWGDGLNNWARNAVYWTGTAWYACPTEAVHEATPWDSAGRSESTYCKVTKTSNVRSGRDISGMKMVDVVAEVRASPLKDSVGDFAAWGPDPVLHASKLQGTFPAGSKLYYYTGSDLLTPLAYGSGSNDPVFFYSALVAGANQAECNRVGANNIPFRDTSNLSLEKMLDRFKGTPCIFNVRSTSAGNVPNEWWTQSTVNIGQISTSYVDPSDSGYFRNGVQNIRASFGADKSVAYWLCLVRASDGSSRNCKAIGTGTYSIETVGDAKVLRFANPPAQTAALTYNRLIVEHNGQVWYGSKAKPTVNKQIRPNLVATKALFSALGIPAPRSGATLTADTLLSDYTNQQGRATSGGTGMYSLGALAFLPGDNTGLVGAWSLSPLAGNVISQTLFFFPDGSFVMTDPVGDVGASSCGGPGYEKGSYSYDASSRVFSVESVSLDTNGCAGLNDNTSVNGRTRALITLSEDKKSATFVSSGEPAVQIYRQTR